MRLDYGRPIPWMMAGLLLVGCPADDPPAADGSSGSTGAMESSTSGQTSAVSVDTTAGDQGGSSSSEGSSSTGLPTEIDMRGTILDFFLMQPIEGADISVLGQPGMTAVSDASGNWEVLGLPVQTFDRFIVADTEEYWGAVVPFTTEYELIEEFELSQVSLEVIDIQIGVLQGQDPTVMVEPDTAVLLVAIEQNTAIMDPTVVQLDPMPDPTTYYAPDANGQPILGNNIAQWSAYPVVVFFNLPPGPEGDYEVTVTHPERECTPDDPQPPTFGRHVNLIRVDCPPPN